MTQPLTMDKALELLHEVTTEYPDARYSWREATFRCQYVQDGLPSCLVGVILYRHDPDTLDMLVKRNLESIDRLWHAWLEGDQDAPDLSFLKGGAYEVLRLAQGAQDRGNRWGDIPQIVQAGMKDDS